MRAVKKAHETGMEVLMDVRLVKTKVYKEDRDYDRGRPGTEGGSKL
jgi:hypothetical protein